MGKRKSWIKNTNNVPFSYSGAIWPTSLYDWSDVNEKTISFSKANCALILSYKYGICFLVFIVACATARLQPQRPCTIVRRQLLRDWSQHLEMLFHSFYYSPRTVLNNGSMLANTLPQKDLVRDQTAAEGHGRLHYPQNSGKFLFQNRSRGFWNTAVVWYCRAFHTVPLVTEAAYLNSLMALGARAGPRKVVSHFKWSALSFLGQLMLWLSRVGERLFWELAGMQNAFLAHGHTQGLGTWRTTDTMWMVRSNILGAEGVSATFFCPLKPSCLLRGKTENVAADFWVQALVGSSTIGSVHLSQEHLGRNWSQPDHSLFPCSLSNTLSNSANWKPWKQWNLGSNF